jgi:hypothetical protein
MAGALPWAAKRAERLVSCIPASGDHFDQLIGQLGLERVPHRRNSADIPKHQHGAAPRH